MVMGISLIIVLSVALKLRLDAIGNVSCDQTGLPNDRVVKICHLVPGAIEVGSVGGCCGAAVGAAVGLLWGCFCCGLC